MLLRTTNSLENLTKPPSVSKPYKRLRLFGYSLTGHTKYWFEELPSGTIATYDQLKRQILELFFPIIKYLERKEEIYKFIQQNGESIYDAWERLKLLLKRCSWHKFDEI